MPNLTVGNQTFQYPNPNDEAGWGEDATGWAKAMTDALSILLVAGDIVPTTLTLQNNQSTFADITGLFFNTNNIRAANISYTVSRLSTASPVAIVESGTMLVNFNTSAAPGSKSSLSLIKNGNAGVIFTVTDTGQITYKSTDIGLTGYIGSIKFSARVLTN